MTSPSDPSRAAASPAALPDTDTVLARIADVLATRLPANGGDPASSYVAKLFSKGPDAALKKVGEGKFEAIKWEDAEALLVEKLGALKGHRGPVLVVFGDAPLVTAESMRRLVAACRRGRAAGRPRPG